MRSAAKTVIAPFKNGSKTADWSSRDSQREESRSLFTETENQNRIQQRIPEKPLWLKREKPANPRFSTGKPAAVGALTTCSGHEFQIRIKTLPQCDLFPLGFVLEHAAAVFQRPAFHFCLCFPKHAEPAT